MAGSPSRGDPCPLELGTGIRGSIASRSGGRHREDLVESQIERPGGTPAGAADKEFLSAQLDFLRRRSLILDSAVVLATLGGATTCAAALVLFLLGTLRGADSAAVLFLFGAAIVFTLIALVTFAIEMLLAGRGLRYIARRHQHRPAPRADRDAQGHAVDDTHRSRIANV